MKLIEILNLNPYISNNTDKHSTHNYVDGFYEENFIKYKNKNINLLEIGILTGGSIALWDKYFENGNIYGVDWANQITINLNSNKIKLYFGDAYNQNTLDVLPNFDIIIDDGPHRLDSMKFVVKHYSKKLNPDGMIVIEDVQDYSWFDELIKEVPENFEYKIIDLRETKNRYDDMIFMMKHKT